MTNVWFDEVPRIDSADDQVRARESAMIHRNPKTAAAVCEVLGISHYEWTDLVVEFGHETFGVARLSILLTPDQLVRMAGIARESTQRELTESPET